MPEPTATRAERPEPREQDELLPGLVRARVRPTRRAASEPEPAAEVDPVARVLVDVPLAHLDRPFDYEVPASMAADAQPGVRVKVRFAGREVDGFVLGRAAQTERGGSLTPLRRVVSAEPVLSPAVAALAGELAERYAGTRSDVLRLAVPSRHAATEKKDSVEPAPPPAHDAAAGEQAWADHPPGPAFLAHLADGGAPRAVWAAAPGTDWPRLLAHAAAAALAGDRGALLVVPDRKDVARVDAALTAVLGPDQHVVLTADAGPAKRYRDFLAVSRGRRRVVVGTRAAAFAPVAGLGLVAIWDDGDDLHAEPRAPYPPRPRDPPAPRRARGRGGPGGWVRDQRGGRPARALRVGAPARPAAGGAAAAGHGQRGRRRRVRPGPRPAGRRHPRAHRGAPGDPRRAGRRPGAGADAAQRVRRRPGL
ncbi:primosomal protein N' family DNA-binding protein [Nocardioides anomalus]|uniref:primosomal protein N' family DNA-binding protein n=1 Tax=Nocardioides anomalus TaxID=2712223 RepID=UPI001E2CD532|nr:hypothetical protein [Nocardioides anomalus]